MMFSMVVMLEKLDVLEGAGDAQPGDLIRPQGLDVLPAETDDCRHLGDRCR
jgi:hypothetical protein